MSGLITRSPKRRDPVSFHGFYSRPLFVSRPLLDHDGLDAWVKANGFLEPLPARTFHVTVALSRIPIRQELPERDSNDLIVRAGQRRRVVCFGGVFALTFGCAALNRRHAEFRRVGASWDHPSYQPHISFAIDDGRDLSMSSLTPYRGRLHFGPESYKEPFADIASLATQRKLMYK